jgi:pyrroline-5-carboxylate reductase
VNSTMFLGGGRITSALVAALRLGGYKKPVVVHDRNARKLQQFKQRYGVQVEPDLSRAVGQSGLLIIAVRPDSLDELLEQIGRIGRPITAVSLAAGVPLAKLQTRLGPLVRWARAMPSPACGKGRGLTAVVFDHAMSATARREVKELFARVGSVLEIPESQFDAFTVTYSPSHGYHALATLAGAAEKLGLPSKIAITAAAHALADGILMWRENETTLHDLLNEAATPGGIAASVTSSMNAAGYRRMVERSLREGLMRARKNAQKLTQPAAFSPQRFADHPPLIHAKQGVTRGKMAVFTNRAANAAFRRMSRTANGARESLARK